MLSRASFALGACALVVCADAAHGQTFSGAPDSPVPEPEFALGRRRVRDGFMLAVGLGPVLGKTNGYPNVAERIGDRALYVSTGRQVGSAVSVYAGGALTDYLNVAFGFQTLAFEDKLWSATGTGIGLRLETFPLRYAIPRLQGLGISADLGVGVATMKSKIVPFKTDGAREYYSLAAFHEWRIAHVLGGHVSLGPELRATFIRSAPLHESAAQVGLRAVFYGGV